MNKYVTAYIQSGGGFSGFFDDLEKLGFSVTGGRGLLKGIKIEIDGTEDNNWLNNLINDTSLGLSKSKKEAMLAAASVLINQSYKLAFVAGVLGNIKNEGAIGMFESSSYGRTGILGRPSGYVYVLQY